MIDSASIVMAKKNEYQLKWIIANQNEYEDKWVLAAKNELARRDSSLYYKIRRLLNSLFQGS